MVKNNVDLGKVLPVQPGGAGRAGSPQRSPGTEFSDLFKKEIHKAGEVRFSAHAQQRLASRHIELSGSDRTSLAEAVDRAAAKGSRDSLVLLRDLALVVSVTNRTVVTAMDVESMEERVVTNIDSAVIVK